VKSAPDDYGPDLADLVDLRFGVISLEVDPLFDALSTEDMVIALDPLFESQTAK